MEKNKLREKPYEAAMFLQLNNICNLDCVYCISKGRPLKHAKIDLEKFERFLRSLDKVFLFIYEGDGEPTLQPNIMELTRLIIDTGHYIAITSNMTSKQIAMIADEIDPKRIDYVIASAHTQELERMGLLDVYFKNCNAFKKKGVTVACIEVGYPELIPKVPELKKLFKKNGLELVFDHFRGECEGRKYPLAYTDEELGAFSLDKNVKEKFNVFCTYCNAGFNFFAAELVLEGGDIFRCRTIRKPIGNIYRNEFKISSEPNLCLKHFCSNPYSRCNDHLHFKAMERHEEFMRGNIFSKAAKHTWAFLREPIKFLMYDVINRLKGWFGRLLIKTSPKTYHKLKKWETKISKKARRK